MTDMEMVAYNRLYDACDNIGLQLQLFIYSYARKRSPMSSNGKWMQGRIGIKVYDADLKKVICSWTQKEAGTPNLDALSISALQFLETNEMI